jgi:uncharacterized protein (TIGR02246 family)
MSMTARSSRRRRTDFVMLLSRMSRTMRRKARLLLAALVLPGAAWCFAAMADTTSDAQAIRDAANAYKAAVERGDGKALAALWTPDGDIVDDLGTVMKGRDTVALLEPPAADATPSGKPVITIKDTNLRFITPDVAVEDATVEVTPPGTAAPLRGRFSATWVRHEGAWKLSALREARGEPGGGSAESLEDLAWMVGDWAVVDDDATGKPASGRPSIEMTVRWNPNRTFLLRDMKITPAGSAANPDAAMHITQRIGWDPLSKSIHSWVFSSDGGHGEAAWSKKDGSWIAQTTAVLPDGSQTSSLNIYTYDGKDRCDWRSLPTHVGGEHMPQIDMTMVRKPGSVKPEGAGR